ncbi:hypothetical protein ACTI_84500 [Actinoplanes sp. OR16]|uniref:RidA family protein n=1 Tax=Actinoplanes sp. OR16 TaxID=946334 RepID=UPI000F6CCE4F|nr:RidA family protein [Actinoplanes sp. OR16]BBH71765.1 hypothetical protein ACTI_84500 [Actinoplanes sp. OR16]
MRRINPEGVFAPPGISQVVTATGTMVFLSGQVAWGAQGDHAAQAGQIAENITIALSAVGATWDDVVKETIWVVDYRPELLPGIVGALRRGSPPASTLVAVPALFAPGYLIEVEIVAMI